MAKSKSKSKSKAKSSQKKQSTMKNTPKAKKKVANKKCTTEKKRQIKKSNTNNDKKTKITAKEKKEENKDTIKKKAKKTSKEIKSKIINKLNTILLKNEPDENKKESTEPKQNLDELPIIMECTESDDEIPDGVANKQFENNDDYCQNDDINIDLNLGEELISQEIKINLDCFVNLPQIPINNIVQEHFVVDMNTVEDSINVESSAEINMELSNFINGMTCAGLDMEVATEKKLTLDHTVKTLQNEEVINCICGFREEDGLMVQCDVCLTWQHALCCGMNNDSEVPENYLCIYCTQPLNVRPAQRYSYARHFLTLGRLPTFSKRTVEKELKKHREDTLARTFQLTAELRKISKLERTLTAKLSIAEEPDHPKLYMWSANWDSKEKSPDFDPTSDDLCIDGPIGERPIESADCRLRLLEKIEADQKQMGIRLLCIFDQIKQLESFDADRKEEEKNLKRILKQLEKDLKTITTAVSIS